MGENASKYWAGVDMNSRSAIQQRLLSGVRRVKYDDLKDFFEEGWLNLPGTPCQGGTVYDVYSKKCWTPKIERCGNYKYEGDCFNSEHSWPKSWWGKAVNSAYSDLYQVLPSDGKTNGMRSSHPFCEVPRPTWESSEGNKVGTCTTPGISGKKGFEPTDRVKGVMARSHFYMTVRYMNQLSCCDRDAVDGAVLKPWTVALMLKWNAAFPPEAWERAFNDRGQKWQNNRNPFIDNSGLAEQLFR